MRKEEEAPPQRDWETTHSLTFTKPADDEHKVPIGARWTICVCVCVCLCVQTCFLKFQLASWTMCVCVCVCIYIHWEATHSLTFTKPADDELKVPIGARWTMCMYVCVYVHICTHTHTHTYIDAMYVCMYTHTHTHIDWQGTIVSRRRMRTQNNVPSTFRDRTWLVSTCMYVCMYVYVHMHFTYI